MGAVLKDLSSFPHLVSRLQTEKVRGDFLVGSPQGFERFYSSDPHSRNTSTCDAKFIVSFIHLHFYVAYYVLPYYRGMP